MMIGGRYEAIPVEEGSALTRLMHHVHQDYVRAGMMSLASGLESDPWSS